MLKFISIVLLAAVAGFAVVVAMQSSEFRVTRSRTISAPPAAVFEEVNDVHKFQDWSPWAKLDPTAKVTFDGPAAGVGATFAWAGNSSVGEGKMAVTESQPNERIGMRLEFIKPFAGTNTVEFTFRPEGEGTVVTWTMAGQKNFITKAIGLFIDCDKMVGGQFEQGLANLETVSKTAKP